MSYVDTCCLMMFINRRDSIRRATRTTAIRNVESLFGRSRPRFLVPVPALGETVQKVHDKHRCDGTEMDMYAELVRLMDGGFIEPRYLQHGRDVSRLFNRVMSVRIEDDRDRISPMDALITATAAVDPECGTMYTTDRDLMNNTILKNKVGRWRDENGYSPMQIDNIMDIMRR